MTTCAACNQTILFGGHKEGDLRFCNEKCAKKGSILRDATQVPESAVLPRVWEIRNGRCPACSGPGPVELHKSYRVWSGLIMTSYSTRQNICCSRCARRARLKDAAFSFAFGWWGFPWGLIWTPIQVIRNLAAMTRAEDATVPSPELVMVVRLQLAVAASAKQPVMATSVLPPR
jgi:hypothetical protein